MKLKLWLYNKIVVCTKVRLYTIYRGKTNPGLTKASAEIIRELLTVKFQISRGLFLVMEKFDNSVYEFNCNLIISTAACCSRGLSSPVHKWSLLFHGMILKRIR